MSKPPDKKVYQASQKAPRGAFCRFRALVLRLRMPTASQHPRPYYSSQRLLSPTPLRLVLGTVARRFAASGAMRFSAAASFTRQAGWGEENADVSAPIVTSVMIAPDGWDCKEGRAEAVGARISAVTGPSIFSASGEGPTACRGRFPFGFARCLARLVRLCADGCSLAGPIADGLGFCCCLRRLYRGTAFSKRGFNNGLIGTFGRSIARDFAGT